MHNTDRTQQYLETQGFEGNFEAPGQEGNFEANYEGNFEQPMQSEFEFMGQGEVYGEQPGAMEGNFEANYEGGWQGEAAFANELIHPMTGEVNEVLEMQLAAELLSVTNEQELEQFLGKLVRGIGRGFKRFARSGFGRALGGVLRNVARVALPIAGKALGSLIPIPGVGTALGGMAANAVGNAIGLEFEGMSHEDREFEVARRIVRIGIEGARGIENMPEGEYVNEMEVQNFLAGLATRLLPGAARLLPGVARAAAGGALGLLPQIGGGLLRGMSRPTAQTSSAGQGSGGIGGGFNISTPGGWNISAGGSAGGQGSFGQAAGINTNAPGLRVPGPGPIPNFPVPPFVGQQPGVGGRPGGPVRPWPGRGPVGPRFGGGRWIRRGRHVLVLNVF